MRPELTPPPARIARLPVDARGYPVPWFVDWVDGVPEFRAADQRKWAIAIREQRCWVCGDILGAHLVFVIGPMCGINRTTSEPPCHRDCAVWSAINCPFLSRPHMVRREDEVINHEQLVATAPGVALPRNPGVTLLWTTRAYRLFDDGRGNPLIRLGDPVRVDWFAQGRAATREEVVESIESGVPALRELAEAQDRKEGAGAVKALERAVAAVLAYLPAREGALV